MKNLIFLLLLAAVNSFAQEADHNYEMAPQVTTCDSLDLSGLSMSQQVKEIENATFRYVQNFQLNRKTGFQGAWFYSCDNKKGILVAKVDGEKRVYKTINRSAWEDLVSSGDFSNFLKGNQANR